MTVIARNKSFVAKRAPDLNQEVLHLLRLFCALADNFR